MTGREQRAGMTAGSAEQSGLLSPDLNMSAQGTSDQVDEHEEMTGSAQGTSTQVDGSREHTGSAEQSSAEDYYKIETGDAALNYKLTNLERIGNKATYLVEHNNNWQSKRSAKDRIVVLKKMKVRSNSGEEINRQDPRRVTREMGSVTSGSSLDIQRQVSNRTVDGGEAGGEQGGRDSSEQSI